ncbi:hypothetical protein Tco_0024229 [Tanacetum coccineum]
MLPCVAGVDLKSAKRHQILELEKMWMNFQRELERQNKVIEAYEVISRRSQVSKTASNIGVVKDVDEFSEGIRAAE